MGHMPDPCGGLDISTTLVTASMEKRRGQQAVTVVHIFQPLDGPEKACTLGNTNIYSAATV